MEIDAVNAEARKAEAEAQERKAQAQAQASEEEAEVDIDVVGLFLNLEKEVIGGEYPTKAGWATDNYSNYSREFVYRKDPQKCYNLLVFRAPLNSGVTADTNQSRNAYIKIVQELNKILTLQDKLYRTNGEALLSDAKSRLGDDETLAINHLNEVLGFSSTNQAWSKKLQPQYQSLSPADKKLFDAEYNKLKKAIESVGITTNSNASTNFSLPLSTDPKADKLIKVSYNF
jgi:hypothetical protein